MDRAVRGTGGHDVTAGIGSVAGAIVGVAIGFSGGPMGAVLGAFAGAVTGAHVGALLAGVVDHLLSMPGSTDGNPVGADETSLGA